MKASVNQIIKFLFNISHEVVCMPTFEEQLI